ncbi:MAG: creatininase family protein [Chloroflexi bacterium]|nr:creatininase family protein [Chloroflexota bacterium]
MLVRFDELDRATCRRQLADGVVLLPVAATEQHGPHLPVGTDRMLVEAVAQAAAARAAATVPVVLAPTLPFGSSPHHLPFGGTLSLATAGYLQVIGDLLESLVQSGARRVLILNGHGGNTELLQVAVRDAALRHTLLAAAAPYWTIAWDALAAAGAHAVAPVPGHAGAFETALMLAVAPQLVAATLPQRDDAPAGDPRGVEALRVARSGWWQAIDGYTDSPARASAALGARWLAAIVPAVADACVALARQPLDAPG